VALAFAFPVRRWIERRPVLVAAAAAIFAAVFALRETGVEADGLALVCLVSIELVALEFGLLAGFAVRQWRSGSWGCGRLTAAPISADLTCS
jgi:hypothetical protein